MPDDDKDDKDVTPPLLPREFPKTNQPARLNEAIANKVNNKEGQCFRCAEASIGFCHHCGQEFCSEHKSKYTIDICYLCITTDNLGIDFQPLEDEEIGDDGKIHVHHGRRIKLIGEGWPSSMQMIESLSDEGLEIFIAERQRLLSEAVKLGEYHRITLAAAQFKKEYNRKSKIERLRRRRDELHQGTLRVGGKAVTGVKAKGLSAEEKLAKQLGLTMVQFQAFKKLVGNK